MDDATQKLVDRGRFAAHYSDVRKISPDLVMDLCAALEAAQRPPVSPEVKAAILRIIVDAMSERDDIVNCASNATEKIVARFSVPSQPVYDEEAVERAAKAMWELRMRPTDPAWKDVDHGVRAEYEKDARAALVAALRGGELTREETNG